jgi:hypothetical protein
VVLGLAHLLLELLDLGFDLGLAVPFATAAARLPAAIRP